MGAHPKTTSNYVSAILAKVQVHDGAEAAAAGRRDRGRR
jgi:DNA-binding NarL/FixJ family response regulator